MLRRAVKVEWRLSIGTIGFSILAAMFEAIGITALIPVLDSIVGTSLTQGFELPLIGSAIGKSGWSPAGRLVAVSLIVLVAVYLASLFGWLADATAVRLRERIQGMIRQAAFEELLMADVGWFSTQRAGALLNRVTSDLWRLNFLLYALTNIILYVCLLIGYSGALVVISPELSLVALVLLGVAGLVIRRVSRGLRSAGTRAASQLEILIARFSERLSAVRTIRSLATEDVEFRAFVLDDEATRIAREHEGQLAVALNPVAEALITTVIVALILIGFVVLVESRNLAGTSLLAFFVAIFRMAPTLQLLANARGIVASNWSAVENIHGFVRSDDKPHTESGKKITTRLKERIVLRGVAYTYPGALRPALAGIDVEIPCGSITAVVGASGAGKSTLLDLLLRLIDPGMGTISWDGTDLRDLDSRSLRKRIGVVGQDTFVFHDTIRANVSYGVDNATDGEILRALEISGAREFVAELPDGLDTVIGERGALLSGGQRQRVAIARAVLRNPDVLLLDEATSALDSETEQQVNRALEELMASRTVVVVPHRLSTVRRANQLVVLDGGRVVEIGTYNELLAAGGALARQHAAMFTSDDNSSGNNEMHAAGEDERGSSEVLDEKER